MEYREFRYMLGFQNELPVLLLCCCCAAAVMLCVA